MSLILLHPSLLLDFFLGYLKFTSSITFRTLFLLNYRNDIRLISPNRRILIQNLINTTSCKDVYTDYPSTSLFVLSEITFTYFQNEPTNIGWFCKFYYFIYLQNRDTYREFLSMNTLTCISFFFLFWFVIVNFLDVTLYKTYVQLLSSDTTGRLFVHRDSSVLRTSHRLLMVPFVRVVCLSSVSRSFGRIVVECLPSVAFREFDKTTVGPDGAYI